MYFQLMAGRTRCIQKTVVVCKRNVYGFMVNRNDFFANFNEHFLLNGKIREFLRSLER